MIVSHLKIYNLVRSGQVRTKIKHALLTLFFEVVRHGYLALRKIHLIFLKVNLQEKGCILLIKNDSLIMSLQKMLWHLREAHTFDRKVVDDL